MTSNDSFRLPIRCKTWKEVERVKKRYLKPVGFGPMGQPIYDYDEVLKYVVFPERR